MNSPKEIASLVSDNVFVPPTGLLQQFLDGHDSISYEPFRSFCEGHGVVIEGYEFLDLLAADQAHTFQEYSNSDGRYWVPAIPEGYISNSLPGDSDDFGDDQIDGITKPALGTVIQPDTTDFEPLTDDEEMGVELDDLPNFDTLPRRRPSRNPAELESADGESPNGLLLEQENPLITKLYWLVDDWQDGRIDKQTFEWLVNEMPSKQPSLENRGPDIWAMVRKILAARVQSSTKV